MKFLIEGHVDLKQKISYWGYPIVHVVLGQNIQPYQVCDHDHSVNISLSRRIFYLG